MSICRAFLLGVLLAVVSPAQQASSPSVPAKPTYKLEGRVVTQGEWIQINGPVVVDSSNNDKILYGPRSFDVHSGAFAFQPLPRGTYTLQATGLSREHHWIHTTHTVVLAKDLTHLDLALLPGTSIAVTVRKESRQPVGRCWWNPLAEALKMADCSDELAARVQLVPVEGRRSPYLSGPGVFKDPIHFTMEGIEPGKYIVQVELPRYPINYVQSMRAANLDLLHEELEVTEGEIVLPIEIVVRDDFGFVKVEMNAVTRPPVIVLLREGVLLAKPQLATLNETNSSFSVAPGSYAVFAFDSTKGEYADPEFLPRYAARAVNVTIAANEKKTIHLDVIHIED